MTLRHLQIFVAVAEEGTMHAAAKKLYISQPSISQSIAELEEHYGIKLFERLSKKLYITEAGSLLLPYARHLLDMYQQTEELMKQQGQIHKLRIGASVSVGTCMITDIIDDMRSLSPDTDIYVTIDNTAKIEQDILNSQLDAGLVEGVIINTSDLICENICEDELLIVASPEHPLASKKGISIHDLSGLDFVARETGSNDRNQFEHFLIENNIIVNKKWISSNTQAIKNAVIRQNGLAILSHMLVADELNNHSLTALKIKNVKINREIKLVYHKNKYFSNDLECFSNAVKKRYEH